MITLTDAQAAQIAAALDIVRNAQARQIVRGRPRKAEIDAVMKNIDARIQDLNRQTREARKAR